MILDESLAFENLKISFENVIIDNGAFNYGAAYVQRHADLVDSLIVWVKKSVLFLLGVKSGNCQFVETGEIDRAELVEPDLHGVVRGTGRVDPFPCVVDIIS